MKEPEGSLRQPDMTPDAEQLRILRWATEVMKCATLSLGGVAFSATTFALLERSGPYGAAAGCATLATLSILGAKKSTDQLKQMVSRPLELSSSPENRATDGS